MIRPRVILGRFAPKDLFLFLLFLFLTDPGAIAAESPLQKVYAIVLEKMADIRDTFKRVELEEVEAKTTRDEEKELQKCYPPIAFQFPQWPKEGTTLLYGEKLLVRVENSELACQEATYRIQTDDSGSIQPGDVGELLFLSVPETPARKYQVNVSSGDENIKTTGFTMLSEKLSKEIKDQMTSLVSESENLNPLLVQALYLQELSETSGELDLYSDSLRLLYVYRLSQSETVDSLYLHLMERTWAHLYE